MRVKNDAIFGIFLRCLIMRELAHKYSTDLDSVDEQRLNRLTVSVTLCQRVLH